MQNKKNKGFTLIELIIGIAILGILVAGAAVLITNLGGGAREALVRSHANAIVNNLNTFNNSVVDDHRVDSPAVVTFDAQGAFTVRSIIGTVGAVAPVDGVRQGQAIGMEIEETVVVPLDMIGEVTPLIGFIGATNYRRGFFYVRDTPS